MPRVPRAARHPVDAVRWVPAESIRANDYNPNTVAMQEMQLLQTSVLNDGFCVEASTPILRADLTWVPAGRLVAGEAIHRVRRGA